MNLVINSKNGIKIVALALSLLCMGLASVQAAGKPPFESKFLDCFIGVSGGIDFMLGTLVVNDYFDNMFLGVLAGSAACLVGEKIITALCMLRNIKINEDTMIDARSATVLVLFVRLLMFSILKRPRAGLQGV